MLFRANSTFEEFGHKLTVAGSKRWGALFQRLFPANDCYFNPFLEQVMRQHIALETLGMPPSMQPNISLHDFEKSSRYQALQNEVSFRALQNQIRLRSNDLKR